MLTQEALSQYKRYLKKKNVLITDASLQNLHETFKELSKSERYDIYFNDFYEFLDKNTELIRSEEKCI